MDQPEEMGDPERALLFTPSRGFLWMLGNLCVMALLMSLLLAIRPDSKEDLVGLAITSAAGFVLVSALLVGRYPAGPFVSQALGLRKSHPLAAPLALILGILAQIPAEAVYRVVLRFAPQSDAQMAEELARLEPTSTLHAIALVAVLVVIVPIAEEVFFRGAVYGALRRAKVPIVSAALVVGVGFTLSHGDPRTLLPIGLAAFILGTVRSTTGSLVPSICAHIGFNSVTILSHIFKTRASELELTLPMEIAGSALVVILLFLFVKLIARHPQALASKRAEEEVFS